MKISRMIAIDDSGKEIILPIKEGAGMFVTEEGQILTLRTTNDNLNMSLMRVLLQQPLVPEQPAPVEEEATTPDKA